MRHGIKLNDILRCQSFSFSCSKFHTVDLLPFWAIFLRKFTTHPFGVTATRRTQPRPTLRETVQLTLEKRGHLSNQLRLSLKLLIVIPKPVWNAFCTFHCDSIEGKSSTLRYMRKPILNLDIWSKHICLAGSITQPPNVHKNEQFGVKEL